MKKILANGMEVNIDNYILFVNDYFSATLEIMDEDAKIIFKDSLNREFDYWEMECYWEEDKDAYDLVDAMKQINKLGKMTAEELVKELAIEFYEFDAYVNPSTAEMYELFKNNAIEDIYCIGENLLIYNWDNR